MRVRVRGEWKPSSGLPQRLAQGQGLEPSMHSPATDLEAEALRPGLLQRATLVFRRLLKSVMEAKKCLNSRYKDASAEIVQVAEVAAQGGGCRGNPIASERTLLNLGFAVCCPSPKPACPME